MGSIIKEQTLVKIENIRKYVFRTAIWMLVGAVVLGALLILLGGNSSAEIMGKFLGTILILALMLLVSVNNFKMIAYKDSFVQVLALLGLVSNIFWAILWILLCWDPELGRVASCGAYVDCITYSVSMIQRLAMAFSFLSFYGLVGSNIWALPEGTKKGLVKPLKVTSVAIATYEVLYLLIMVFNDYDFKSDLSARFGMLAGFLAVAWFVVTLVAAIISKSEKNKNELAEKKAKEIQNNSNPQAVQPVNVDNAVEQTPIVPKTDDELRVEIEEKVRREMIEKEVRERLEKEAQNKQSE